MLQVDVGMRSDLIHNIGECLSTHMRCDGRDKEREREREREEVMGYAHNTQMPKRWMEGRG